MNCTCSKNNTEFYKDFELKNFNTLKISSKADLAFFVKDEAQLCSVFRMYKNAKTLGWGSNTLLSSKGVREPVIITRKMSEISQRCEIMEIEAGASAPKVALEAYNNSLSGFEFLIGIPSTLGGAVAMNAGAHEQTISDKLISVRVYDIKEDKIITLSKDELNFSYRNSLIKQNTDRYALISAKFQLEKRGKEEIKKRMDENTEFRKRVQPSLVMPNLGSVFKNPTLPDGQKLSAGMLVDKCGLKGFHVGNAGVWEHYGNFVINYLNCTSSEYLQVLYKMYTSVKEKFNIELECEIMRIGEFSAQEDEIWRVIKKS